MPQMAPLNWLTLMMYFIVILLLFNIMNYYSFTYNTTKSKIKKFGKTKINWKW